MNTVPDPLHDLLVRVASGDLDPAEAARLLDDAADAGSTPPRPTSDHVRAVLLHAGGVQLRVVADPDVATAVADGPHSVRHDGDTLVIDAPSSDGYQVRPAPRFLGWVPATWTVSGGHKVTVRVNPALPLTIEGTACAVTVSGLRAAVTLGGTSSSVKVRDHRGAIHGGVAMSSVSIAGVVTGPSDLACELGSLQLRLEPGSDVAISATAEMGSVKLAGVKSPSFPDGTARQELTVGAGTSPLTLTVRMGSATVATS